MKTAEKREQKTQTRRAPPSELLGIPARLLAAMVARGMSKAELARAAEVDRAVVSLATNGKRLAGIQAANVIRLARGLSVDPGWLLTGRGNMDGAVPIVAQDGPEFAALVAAVAAEIGRK